MSTITQLHNTSLEELISNLSEAFRMEIEQLKVHFSPRQPDELLTRDEVAKLLKINISSVYNWTKQGTLKRHAIGGRVYFKRSEIEESLIPY